MFGIQPFDSSYGASAGCINKEIFLGGEISRDRAPGELAMRTAYESFFLFWKPAILFYVCCYAISGVQYVSNSSTVVEGEGLGIGQTQILSKKCAATPLFAATLGNIC